MPQPPENLLDLYSDTKKCAELVGLRYMSDTEIGIVRRKQGQGYSYYKRNARVTDPALKQHIKDLVIPPAWQDVCICPSTNGHILATGYDEKGRKQYIYHPKWRTMRDLIKFYRMITFANVLPKIRRDIDHNLAKRTLCQDKVMATMLWILDNAYIRIGNDTYFEENDSVGLTTLTDKNIVLAGPVITLTFKAKSGKQRTITFEHAAIAKTLSELQSVPGARLFRFQDTTNAWQPIDAPLLNHYLHDLTHVPISAKDFRTWGGTLMAYMYLRKVQHATPEKKPEKAVIAAVDQAAAILGNTRAVARSSYVHPDLLSAYVSQDFNKYYATAARQPKRAGLDKTETELFSVLQQLFSSEFAVL
ncbi:MAG TPA: hypothetical protein VFN56_04695 [Candidatus Saccharimonadales bacterium]|nr:hypothetical protein [Candidatus Saccharimonadales bacterium]